jgi:Zn-dependent M16 (insulinase) family peptidase
MATEVRKRLLDNPRRLWVRARPDADFHRRREQAEAAQVTAAIAALDAAGLANLRTRAQELAAHQATHDDPTVLPDLELSDVPRRRRWVAGHPQGGGLTTYPVGTNGVLHQVAAFTLPALDDGDLDLLPLAVRTIGALGVGARTYDQQAARLNRLCGGLWGWTDVVADPTDPASVRGFLICEIKGLADRQGDYAGLLAESLDQTRFDEHDRLRELVDESVQRLHGAVAGRGNQLAARAAMRGFGSAASLAHRLGGLGRLARLKRLADDIDDEAPGGDDAVARLGARLQALLRKLTPATPTCALIGDAAERAQVMAAARAAWSRPGAPAAPTGAGALAAPAPRAEPPLAYATGTAVNYCALAFPAVALAHPDAPALAVATRVLTNQVLHPKLREQGGAYGGSAGYQSANAAVVLTSYRDPRLAGTFADMRAALGWLRTCPDDPRMFKEAVLGVIAGLDAPGSPAGEARSRFAGDLKGITPARLDEYRARVLAVDPAAVRAAADRWLPPDGGSPAVVTSTANAEASNMGWTIEQL